MSNTKRPAYNVSEIIREQYQLVKTERELEALLKKVNDQINQLLVSEAFTSFKCFSILSNLI